MCRGENVKNDGFCCRVIQVRMGQDTPFFQSQVEDVKQVHIRRVPLLLSYCLVGVQYIVLVDGKPRVLQLGVQALLLEGAEYR